MIYLLIGILVGFGAWYAYHVWQKVVYKRRTQEAVRLINEERAPVQASNEYLYRRWNPAPKDFPFHERQHQQDILNGTYTPPSPEQLRTLNKAIESAKKNPPVYRESYAKYANDEDARRANPSDVIAMAMIADAIISTPDATDSFSAGGGDFGGGGASGSWDSSPDTSSSSSYDSGSSSSYDSGGGSDSGSFGGPD